jgi:hypothetical protein
VVDVCKTVVWWSLGQNMIAAIDLFNTQSKMNIQLGVGVDEGTVDIGTCTQVVFVA